MRLFHISDIHLSFSGENAGQILKPMDKRSWSIGSPNYVRYLDRIWADAQKLGITEQDILFITGDLSHDMSKKHIRANLDYIDALPGFKVLIRGNHDHQWDFGLIRHGGLPRNTILIEEGSFQCVGPYLIGCWSDHRRAHEKMGGDQEAFTGTEEEVMAMAEHFAKMARIHKKVPLMISHYPVPEHLAQLIGLQGMKLYLSGHVHVTRGSAPGGTDWTWYNKTAKETDDLEFNGCFFSTATTDVLLNKHGIIIKELPVPQPKEPGPHPKQVKRPDVPSPEVRVLVGVPGSGKSTYAAKLVEQGFVRISQDDLGSKRACIEAFEKALEAGRKVVVDRTNVSRSQRSTWIDLARKYRAKQVTCIVFRAAREICVKRVMDRRDHPTINDKVPADRKAAIVDIFLGSYEEPNLREGFKTVAFIDT